MQLLKMMMNVPSRFFCGKKQVKNNIIVKCIPNSIIYILLIIFINVYFIRIPEYLTESTGMLNNPASIKQETGLPWERHIRILEL